MQDRYAFDVGDFGKFGLLRHLTSGATPLSLGVLWYTCDREAVAKDGKHLGYLELRRERLSEKGARFRVCDSQLYDLFRNAMTRPDAVRSMAQLENLGIFTSATLKFHRDLVCAGESRRTWFLKACSAVKDCDVVFCDPDNGIAEPGSDTERSRSPKHLLIEELRDLHGEGCAIAVYHHLNRRTKHKEQMVRWIKELQRQLRTDVSAVRFRRGTSRAFFVASGQRVPDLANRVHHLAKTDWCRQNHFETVHE
jgi:hypothetical protein